MHRLGWDLQLIEYGDLRWRLTFYVTGMAHSITGGSAWEACAMARGPAGGVAGVQIVNGIRVSIAKSTLAMAGVDSNDFNRASANRVRS
jgi:hypothetical protein